MPDLALATVIVPILQGKFTAKTKLVFNSNENHAPGDRKKQVHIRMFIHSIILCYFSNRMRKLNCYDKNKPETFLCMQCQLSASESSI